MPEFAVPPVPEFLSTWISAQRWYAGKGGESTWERVGGFFLADPAGDAVISVNLLLDHAQHPLLYQVPLTERRERVATLEHALIGTVDDGDGLRYLYDGPRDPAFAAALVRLILDEGAVRPDDHSPGLAARGHSAPTTPALEVVSSKVLSGEQSNTSIIYETASLDGQPAQPVICKIFRTLHHGENPDVTLLSALGSAGSTVVPLSVGHITGQWRDAGEPAGFAHGHLSFAQEFLPGVQDAWRVALLAAESDEDFSERAYTLGEATADVHTTLAAVLPTRAATTDDIAAVIASMHARFELAASEVPSIAQYRDAIAAVYATAATAEWPAMQRIHGDFHLGQVLSVPGRGWVILDFEGEPMRPMRERSMLDSPLRDIAGMLRSFDYVAGSVAISHPGSAAAAWSASARELFLDGYIARTGFDLRANSAVLDAFEIDKALYEAVYEARNRPDWLSIPVTAIERLAHRTAPTG
ncbi:maltokinase N-terminal cap-like domain-containing protein [Marisediminicola senii]|uniref:maltokinase N-terminal cap-like domain-containing protein n=1 Tax=Marisediminicola senii TaxID=2711233 RepID=UPI0013ED2EEE|nr:phosphotransferase [Marisediminicola senii]